MEHFKRLKSKLVQYLKTLKATYLKRGTHSRFVFILRAALPSIVAVLLGLLFITPEIKDLKKIKIDIPKLESSGKISFTMDNGQFYGQGNAGMIFSLSIDNFKENRVDEVMEFTKINGKIFLKDASWIDITTDKGSYMRRDKQVVLTGNIRILDDQDNRISTDEVVVDLETTEVKGDKPITADTYFGTINGSGFNFRRGDRYLFIGKVSAKIDSAKLNRR